MRWQLILGAVIGLLFLVAPTSALELQQLDGEWWLGSSRDNAAAVIKFENQLFGTVDISGEGVSLPQRAGFSIDPGQTVLLEANGQITGDVAVTSDDGRSGTWTISGGRFVFLRNRLTLRGRLVFGVGAGSKMVLGGTRIEDRDDETMRQLLRGRSSEVGVRGARRTVSRRIDVILAEHETRFYPFYQLYAGGNIRRGNERTKLGAGGTVLLTPRGGLIGFVGANTFSIAGNEDPLGFLDTIDALPANAVLKGSLPGFKRVTGDERPAARLRLATTNNSIRLRMNGQLGPFVVDVVGGEVSEEN